MSRSGLCQFPLPSAEFALKAARLCQVEKCSYQPSIDTVQVQPEAKSTTLEARLSLSVQNLLQQNGDVTVDTRRI